MATPILTRSERIRAGDASALSSALASKDISLKNADDKTIADITLDLIERGKKRVEQFWVPTWMQLYYMFLGFQHLSWSKGRRKWFPIALEEDRRRVVNLMIGRALTIANKQIIHKPDFETMPSVPGPLAREEASQALRVLQHLWHENEFQQTNVLRSLLQAIFGWAGYHAEWDPSMHPQPPMPAMAMGLDGQPIVGPDGNPQVMLDGRGAVKMEEGKPLGDINVNLLTVFDTIFDPNIKSPQHKTWTWVATRRCQATGDIYARFKEWVDEEEDAIDWSGNLMQDLGSFLDGSSGAAESALVGMSDQKMRGTAMVYEYHERASDIEGFEEGLRVVVSGGKLLDMSTSEIRNGRIPIFGYPLIPLPLSPLGLTPLFAMRDPQMRFNKACGKLDKAMSRMADPLLVFPEGSLRTESHAGNRGLAYDSMMGKPDLLQYPGISSAVVSALGNAKEAVNEAGSIHEFSLGQTLGASPQPAQTVQLMMEADQGDTSLGMLLASSSDALLGEALLDLARNNYTTDRVAYVLADYEEPEVFMASGAEIGQGVRVRVQQGSALPHLRGAAQQKLLTLMSTGAFQQFQSDPSFITRIAEFMDLPTPRVVDDFVSLHRKKQERELRAVLQGRPIEVDPGDSHKEHVEVLARFRLTTDWEQLDDMTKQVINQHLQQHQQALAAEEQQQMQKQLQMLALQEAAKASARNR